MESVPAGVSSYSQPNGYISVPHELYQAKPGSHEAGGFVNHAVIARLLIWKCAENLRKRFIFFMLPVRFTKSPDCLPPTGTVAGECSCQHLHSQPMDIFLFYRNCTSRSWQWLCQQLCDLCCNCHLHIWLGNVFSLSVCPCVQIMTFDFWTPSHRNFILVCRYNFTISRSSLSNMVIGSRSNKKNSPVEGWGGLSKKSNVKMSKEYPKLPIMHNMSICQKVKQLDYGWYS